MPPRDLFDLNPIYERVFYWNYCEFISAHSHELGFYPRQMVEESEIAEEEEEEEEEAEVINDRTLWDIEEFFEDLARQYPGAVRNEEDGFEVEELSDDDMSVIDLTLGDGTVDDPIDLTCDE